MLKENASQDKAPLQTNTNHSSHWVCASRLQTHVRRVGDHCATDVCITQMGSAYYVAMTLDQSHISDFDKQINNFINQQAFTGLKYT